LTSTGIVTLMVTAQRWIALVGALTVVVLLAGACRATPDVVVLTGQESDRSIRSQETASDRDQAAEPVLAQAGPRTVDFDLTRNDVACEASDLNSFDETVFLVAHVVVDGVLGAACFGKPDERLTRSWRVLAAITPQGQLSDLSLFGGYVSSEEGETTLAFVNVLDIEGTEYQMSINLDEAESDPDELKLTMAHELSHVFVSLPTQLDRYTLPDECTTWDNGEGCYFETSLMWEWIQRFWNEGLIDQINPLVAPSGDAGEVRCEVHGRFLGAYAASSPEEDFAESFSAFVFQLKVDTPGLQDKMAWFAQQPGLLEFRNRAVEVGFGPLRNEFPDCGTAS